MATRYAIVIGPGWYGSGTPVQAERVCKDKRLALRLAAKYARELQAAMAPHGYTVASYRVVETTATTRRGATWAFGWMLDNTPSVKE